MQIIEFDRHDPLARQNWFTVEERVQQHDRPHGWARTFDSFSATVQNPPSEFFRPVRIAAVDDSGTWLGTGEAGLSLQDNTHLAEVEVLVMPEARRQGVGTALFRAVEETCTKEGRTTIEGELYVPTGAAPSTSPGHAFSESFGFTSAHQEDHMVLALPVPEDRITALAALGAAGSAYEIVTWGARCPDEYAADYCAMRTQMANDVPTGNSDWEPVTFDEQRLRSDEERLAAGWIQIIAAARRRADGAMGGYSMLMLPIGGGAAMQDDTLVMPEHRGHRVGTRLKLATLAILQEQHPQRTTLHTWTEPDNHAMCRTNADFGYVARERMHEMQRRSS